MRKFQENFQQISRKFVNFKKFNKTLTKFEKYIEMLQYFWREFREMLKKQDYFYTTLEMHEKFSENLHNYYNDLVSFKNNLLYLMY